MTGDMVWATFHRSADGEKVEPDPEDGEFVSGCRGGGFFTFKRTPRHVSGGGITYSVGVIVSSRLFNARFPSF